MSNVGSPGSAWRYVILHFLPSRRGCATIVRMAPENDCPFHWDIESRAAFAPRFLCVRATTRAGRPGCRGLPLLGGRLLLGDRVFLAKLELRLRENVELEREAPVSVLEGDPGAVPVALAAFAGVDDVDGLAQSEVCEALQLSKTRISRFHSAGVETVQKLLLLGSALEHEHVAKSVAQLSERRPREVLLALYRDRLNYPSARSKLGVGATELEELHRAALEALIQRGRS